MSIVYFIIVLGLLIFVHELGHFLVAKWCGVGVLRFSVGFGPAILRFRRKETEYQVSIIPLGGYVRMVGDMPDYITSSPEEEKSQEKLQEIAPEVKACLENKDRWFIQKSLGARSAIVFAGPWFNFVFAFITVLISLLLYGEPYPIEEPIIGSVSKGSPAERAGLQVDDLVLSVNEAPVLTWEKLATTIHSGTGNPVALKVKRGDQELFFELSPQLQEQPSLDGSNAPVYMVGIKGKSAHKDVGLGVAVYDSIMWTVNVSALTYHGLWLMITGSISPKEIAGPVFIFQEANRKAQAGFEDFLMFLATLSVNLAVLNLLPIPVLDGGHLLFFLLEFLVGPISLRKKEFAQQVGVVLLLSLMVFAVHNDIFRDHTEPGALKWDDRAGAATDPTGTVKQVEP